MNQFSWNVKQWTTLFGDEPFLGTTAAKDSLA